jgi:hypothetical protein
MTRDAKDVRTSMTNIGGSIVHLGMTNLKPRVNLYDTIFRKQGYTMAQPTELV